MITTTANLATLNTNVAVLSSQLAAEVTNRAAAVAVLSSQLAAEVTNRAAAVTVLSSQLAAEVTNRAAAATSEYWLDTSVDMSETILSTVVPANTPNVILKISGVGFGTYYTPLFQTSFTCVFSNPFGNKTSFGVVMPDQLATFIYYHVECPVPVFPPGINVTVSLYKTTGQVVPFAGFANANVLTIAYWWSSVTTAPVSTASNVMVTGVGFNVLSPQAYACLFDGYSGTGPLSRTTTVPAATSSTLLNCGVTPSGFTVVNGAMTVNFTLYEVASNGSRTVIVPMVDISNVLTLSSCLNNAKDGDETGMFTRK